MYFCGVKRSENGKIVCNDAKNDYLCTEFVPKSNLDELHTYCWRSARLNLVNSTLMLDKSWQVGTSLEDMTALLILHHGLPEPNRENNKGNPCSPFLYLNTADMLKPDSGGKILNFYFLWQHVSYIFRTEMFKSTIREIVWKTLHVKWAVTYKASHFVMTMFLCRSKLNRGW